MLLTLLSYRLKLGGQSELKSWLVSTIVREKGKRDPGAISSIETLSFLASDWGGRVDKGKSQ